MTEITQDYAEGKILIDRTSGSQLKYVNTVKLDDNSLALFNGIIAARQKLKQDENELLDIVKKSFENRFAFAGMKISEVNINADGVYVTWVRSPYDSWGKGLTVHVLEYKKSETDNASPDPYKELANRHDLKMLLNSGVLTKAEKRKVLGLPEIEGGKE